MDPSAALIAGLAAGLAVAMQVGAVSLMLVETAVAGGPRVGIAAHAPQRQLLQEAKRYFEESPWQPAFLGLREWQDPTLEQADVLLTPVGDATAPFSGTAGCLLGTDGITFFTTPTEADVQRTLRMAAEWNAMKLNEHIAEELAHGPL